MKESDNYPHLKIEGKLYYIPNPLDALERGFFKLKDTGEIFKVNGIVPNVQPGCLAFEKYEGNLVYQFELPVAKRVI